jgi:hypothetical protein
MEFYYLEAVAGMNITSLKCSGAFTNVKELFLKPKVFLYCHGCYLKARTVLVLAN